MRVLFVVSGNHGKISPVVKAQGDALLKAGVEIEYFLIKGKGVKGYLKQIKPLREHCRKGGYDVVHAHFSFSAYVASLAGVKPLVVSLMGSDLKASRWNKMAIRLFAALFNWREVIVKSRDMAKDLPIKNLHIIPNGVDMELFIPMDKTACRKKLGWEESGKHILFPANPDRKEKDYPLAASSVALLGDGVQIHAFRNVPHDETVYYYNAADVVLLTSKWEGSPNAIKEAMACSRPIVCTDVGDVRERLTGVAHGWVVDKFDEKTIAAALQSAIDFNGRNNGREKIVTDKLDNSSIVQRLKEVYSSVIS